MSTHVVRFTVASIALVSLLTFTFAAKKLPSEGNPVPSGTSSDPTYGVTEKNPIRVGQKNGGARDEDMYLSSLLGPKGEKLEYARLGSCCTFKTPNAWVGGKALLDKYQVSYPGLENSVFLYLDMYDYEQPLVPVGFTKAP
jgi:hypothetical protein